MPNLVKTGRKIMYAVVPLLFFGGVYVAKAYEDDVDVEGLTSEIALIKAELERRRPSNESLGGKSTDTDEESTAALIARLRIAEKALYCTDPNDPEVCDNRQEVFEAAAELQDLSRSAVVVLDTKKDRGVIKKRRGLWKVRGSTLKRTQKVCDDEQFSDQPAPGRCSGFFIGKDKIVTAGHCISDKSFADKVFVFDFKVGSDSSSDATLEFNDDQVFTAAEIIGREKNTQRKEDWAIVRLDRAPPDRKPLKLSPEKTSDTTKLCVIGHPVGLPMKVACGANVRKNTHSQYFVSPLDAFGGNSGSVVVNQDSKIVEGVLVRGEPDFVYKGNCRVSKVCPINGCGGEHVTRSSILVSYLADLQN